MIVQSEKNVNLGWDSRRGRSRNHAQKIIVEAHSGTIEVASELGQGTEFCIRQPFSSKVV